MDDFTGNSLFGESPDEANHRWMSAKTDTQSSILEDGFGLATAAVVDFGLSAYNSLPLVDEVGTGEVLRKINNNAARIYEQNPETVQALSLVGGAFVGGGLALKGMNYLRAGAKGVNWFSDAGKAANLDKVTEAFARGQEGIRDMKAAQKSIMINGITNNVVDAAAMEIAMLGTMNAHPMLEDYWEHPAQNFGLSLAFGGVIGGGAAAIADRFAINAAKTAIESKALKTVYQESGYASVNPTVSAVDRLQQTEMNINSFEKIIKKVDDSPDQYNQLTKEYATKARELEQAKQLRTFEEIASTDIRNLPNEEMTAIRQLATKHSGFAGAEAIDFLRLNKEELDSNQFFSKGLQEKLTTDPVKSINTVNNKDRISDVIYLPEFDSFVPRGQAIHYTRAQALGKDIDTLAKELGPNVGRAANGDTILDLRRGNTASIDGMFLGALKAVDDFSTKQLKAATFDATDLPVMNGLLAKLNKEMAKPDYDGSLSDIKMVAIQPDGSKQYYTPQILAERINQVKETEIKAMLRGGAPLQSIAIRTNTPLETVAAFATAPARQKTFAHLMTSGGNYSPHSYTSMEEVPTYLSATKAPLVVKTSIEKAPIARMMSALDDKTMHTINQEYVEQTLMVTKSNVGKEVYNYLYGGIDKKPLFDMLKNSIGEFGNNNLGNTFFQSADFFLRKTGVAGMAVTTIGKDVLGLSRRAVESVTKPISDKMAAIVRAGEAAQVEANIALTIRAQNQGVIQYNPTTRMLEKQVQGLDESGKKINKWEGLQFQDKDFTVKFDEVDDFLVSAQQTGRELFEQKNTIHRILGVKDVNDLGFWTPAFNPKGKFASYVFNNDTQETSILLGRNADDLKAQEEVYRKGIPDNLKDKIVIVDKSQQDLYNQLKGRVDPLTMERADVSRFKSGSSSAAIVPADTRLFEEMIGGYEHYVESNVRKMVSFSMYDTLDMLDKISLMNRAKFENQPLTKLQSYLNRPEDGANAVKNILLGNNNLHDYEMWKSYNDTFEAAGTYALNTITKVLSPVIESVGMIANKFKVGESGANVRLKESTDYEKISKELERAGVPNPWAMFDKAAAEAYGLNSITEHPNTSARLIYASNAFAATFALRVLDVAQPLVNAMSMPIMTSLAVANKMPESFLGIQKQTVNIGIAQAMHEGARFGFSTEGQRLLGKFKELGYLKGYVSEANDLAKLSRSFDKGAIASVEKLLSSKIIDNMSFLSDKGEEVVRHQTLMTGAAMAKRLYPELGDAGVTIFARDFMDKALGNYHGPQRPVFFQGTAGVAMGLFQTYMLSIGQGIYRHLELKNYKAIGKAALLQQGVFGASSMPGFDQVSTAIGDHYSDQNIDLTTGSYRALNNTTADTLLYGMPANLGAAFYTRGDLQPRANTTFMGVQNLAAVNLVTQATQAAAKVVGSLGAPLPDVARSFGEALSLQSVSRPIARLSELATGNSITGSGNTVSTPEEVWSMAGVTARLMSTRPFEEAKIREAMNMKTVYDKLDYQSRQNAVKELRTAIRGGTLDGELIESVALRYMQNNGTATGWRSALNEAMAKTTTNGKEHLLDNLKPTSPLNFMIDSLDGY